MSCPWCRDLPPGNCFTDDVSIDKFPPLMERCESLRRHAISLEGSDVDSEMSSEYEEGPSFATGLDGSSKTYEQEFACFDKIPGEVSIWSPIWSPAAQSSAIASSPIIAGADCSPQLMYSFPPFDDESSNVDESPDDKLDVTGVTNVTNITDVTNLTSDTSVTNNTNVTDLEDIVPAMNDDSATSTNSSATRRRLSFADSVLLRKLFYSKPNVALSRSLSF